MRKSTEYKGKLISRVKKPKTSTVLTIVNLIVFILSVYFAYQANILFKNANDLSQKNADNSNKNAQQANKLQELSIKTFAKDSELSRIAKSKELADKTYNELFENEDYKEILEKIKFNSPVKDIKKLEYIVDRYEDLGDTFCRQVIDRETINLKFYFSLNDVCNNNQIYSFYNGRKNATATLCYEFFPDSPFARTALKDFRWCKAMTHD